MIIHWQCIMNIIFINIACPENCTGGLNMCYKAGDGAEAKIECCNYNADGNCTDSCDINKVPNDTYHCVGKYRIFMYIMHNFKT